MKITLQGAIENGYVSKTKRTTWIRHIKKLFDEEVETKMALVHKLRLEIRQASEGHQSLRLRNDLAGAIRDIRAISFRFTKLPDSPKLSDLNAIYETSCEVNDTEMPLRNFEAEFVKEYKDFARNVKRLRHGIRKQTADCHSGVYDLVIAAADGDSVAFKKLTEDLGEFIGKIAGYYQPRLKNETRDEIKTYIFDAMLQAIHDWRKNKHLSYMQWIVGRVRRALKDIRIATYQKEAVEPAYAPETLEQIEGEQQMESRYGNVEGKKRKALSYGSKGEIWIWDASRLVGVCAQTLRNWDASGKFPCKWQEKNGKLYRYYTQEDIGKLYKLISREIYTDKYRIKTVAYVFKTSVKTLKRWETSGKIPKAKQDNEGRYYTVEDVKNIREITKRTIERPKLSKREELAELVKGYRYILTQVNNTWK